MPNTLPTYKEKFPQARETPYWEGHLTGWLAYSDLALPIIEKRGRRIGELADTIEEYEVRLINQQAEIERLRGTFGHYHVAGTTKGLHIDTCASCGLDLRDRIHTREA